MSSPIQPKEPALQDTDPMPFGKHKGTPMQDVPATYLLWLWDEFCNNELVDNYLHNSLHALIVDCPDRIVKRKVTDLNPKINKRTPESKKEATHGVYKPNVPPTPKRKDHNFPDEPPLSYFDGDTHEDELPDELN